MISVFARHGADYPAGKLDPEGPPPFNMPSWRRSIPEDDVDAVIAYLISIYDFDDY